MMSKTKVKQGKSPWPVEQTIETPSSSPGDSPVVVTPKDVSPENATARDMTERKVHSDDLAEREEALLDEANDLSFPASDPIAVPRFQTAEDILNAEKEKRKSRMPDR